MTMVSPSTEDVLAWLKREEQDAKNRGQIFNLQAALANQTSRMGLSYWTHIARMQAYSENVLAARGITAYFNPSNIYRPLGFGIAGQPGYYSWSTIKSMYNLRGPQATGPFTQD